MSKFIINGGNNVSGEINVSGAKNEALKMLAASVLSDEEWHLKNIPDIADVRIMIQILEDIGATVEKRGRNEYGIKCNSIKKTELNPVLVSKIRASIMFMAPLLSRFGEVKFPSPGGDAIGRHPIDIFLNNFKSMGAEVERKDDYYHIKAKRLVGSKFVFPWISHTATESAIMAACLAKGKTILINSACEPEIVALCENLNKCGAKISGIGTHTIEIDGVNRLVGGDFRMIPDRIEAGTFAILGALSGRDLEIKNCEPSHLEVFWKMLEKVGVKFDINKNNVYIKNSSSFNHCELRTREYPGFATDLQAPFTVLLTQADGMSLVHEIIYEGRLFYTDILNKMGANIVMCDPHRVVVSGPNKLYGIKMESPDIRAGISLVLAALIAEGESEIENIEQIDRGYEDIANRLKSIGADIKRI